VTDAIEVDEALLALKIAFLVLLYLFIWLIVRSATRDLRVAPQESIILGADEAAELRAQLEPPRAVRLTVLASPALQPGATLEIAQPIHVGRGAENGLRLEDDDFVSSRHARFEPRTDGLWVEDVGSTNGTYVNGARVTSARLLHTGDVVRIGQTDFQVAA
jgi:pSer/pThr/pTyr-binding forkhead associated (FHA) protein